MCARPYKLERVLHATLDPQGPGLARLHLIPLQNSRESLLVINGWHMLNIGQSWTALLAEFIIELQHYPQGRELSPTEVKQLTDSVVSKVRRYYPFTFKKRLLRDLDTIIRLVLGVAQQQVDAESTITLDELADQLRAPLRVDLVIKSMRSPDDCPCHCVMCYARGQEAMLVEELDTASWKRIIDRLWELGVVQLTFTGGEPTERPDLPELIAHAQQFITRVNTCGHALTPEYVAALKAAELDAVQITFHSLKADIHNRLVGARGGWQKTVNGILAAVNGGLNLSVNIPISRANAPSFISTLRYLSRLGVRHVSCSALIPTGSAPSLVKRGGSLSAPELDALLAQATSVAQEIGVDLIFTSPVCLTELNPANHGLNLPVCGAAFTNMAITPNGKVVPCQSWLNDPNGLGDLLTDPWDSIWNSDLAVMLRTHQLLAPECADCPLYLTCRGGCPLRVVGG